MKDLFVWLQQEVSNSIQLLDNEIITDEVQETIFSSSRDYLANSNLILDKLIVLLTENELDISKLITLIAKLKAKARDADEDIITQEMIIKLLEIGTIKQEGK